MSTSWLPSKQKVDSVLQFAMENILEMTASRTSTTNTFEMITESRTANRTRAEELLVTTMSPCSHWQPFQSRVLRTKNKSTTKIQYKDTTCTVSMPCNEGDSARRHPNAIVQIKKLPGSTAVIENELNGCNGIDTCSKMQTSALFLGSSQQMLIPWRIQVDANSYDDTTVVSIAARVSSPINSLQPGPLKAWLQCSFPCK